MELLLSLCRYSIAWLFLIAAVSKLINKNAFSHSLVESFGMPESLRTVSALTIATLEISIAWWLFSALGSAKIAMTLALSMMAMFSLVLVLTYLWRGPVTCNCFGEQRRTFSIADLARNAIMICAMSLYLVSPELQLQSSMFMPVLSIAFVFAVVLIHLHEATELLTKWSDYD
ncbi:MauE/DoxX family redox-associated membrane protein [Rheinheimera baltica]|uniref:MauE/DoxX family redox-associated membrane protein n=1 Tax=Rheinheimera baltica TaxID=67576 RepID=UPI00273E11E1|nr:MauE/DoxX family redox-associated membrane protein [Rheinheimera baltica]MDP5189722.1 hypothetical protein [Rheinheimera baltica]